MGIINNAAINHFLVDANGAGTNLDSSDFTLSSTGVWVVSVHITGVADCNTAGS